MTLYTVKRAVVKVAIGPASGNRVARILQAGDVVPGGVDQELLDSLEKRSLIEKVAEDSDTDEIPEGDPTDKWTVKQLKAFAESKGIELGDAKNKSEILVLVTAPPAGQ